MKTSNKKWKVLLVVIVAVAAAVFFMMRPKNGDPNGESNQEIAPTMGPIQSFISTTGTVLPQNRLELKPPINGRVEKILVREGELVKKGRILAWLSSTERAALLDAAKEKGEDALKYWEDAYKPIPLPAPIDGEIIVATVQPGQTVTTADAVLVLSDRLIVRAQIDETDVGKIKLDQSGVVSLDAYPNVKIDATVEHIYYESQTVNNVTIYNVDLVSKKVPDFFRSGMNANIDFLIEKKENALLVPNEAVHKDKDGSYVLLSRGAGREPVRQAVTPGISDDKNTEIVSGLTAEEKILLKLQKYALPSAASGTNPFLPSRARSSNRR